MPLVVAVLSYPFGFSPSGQPNTVEQDSPDQDAQLIAALVLTRYGERHLVPGFGTPDPTFGEIDTAALEAATTLFGPDVGISNVAVRVTGPGSQDVVIEFD